MYNLFKHGYLLTIRIINGVSLAASLMVILSFLMFKPLRRASGHYSAWVAISNIINCFFVMLDGKVGTEQCMMSAFGRTYANFVSLAVAVVIADRIYWLVQGTGKSGSSLRIGRKEFILVWVLPIFPSLIPFFFNAYGKPPGGRWCWLNQHANDELFLFYYGPLWMVIVYTFVIYLETYRVAQQKVRVYSFGAFLLCDSGYTATAVGGEYWCCCW